MNDNTIKKVLNEKLINIENLVWWDVISFTWPIWQWIKRNFRSFIEALKRNNPENKKISIILTTTGWTAEWAEDIVTILRENYDIVDFIIPDFAMSAWTILTMSWDDIYMDYASTLWPIDPQIVWNDWKYIPASWYLDTINELILKERNWESLTQSELNIILKADVWMLKFIEQAKRLTVTLLEEWLVKYKFKDWAIHEWNFNKHLKWKVVTEQEKEKRAREIAEALWDTNIWHTHWRSIDIKKLRTILKLKIKDFWEIEWLNLAIKEYYDILSILTPNKNNWFLHSRIFI